jgi:hypothetical protein
MKAVHAAALPIGIFLVGFGGVLLFIAFHNLPAGVQNLSDLLGHIRSEISNTSAAGG